MHRLKTPFRILLICLFAATGSIAQQKSQPNVNEIVLEAIQGDDDTAPYGPCFKITFRRDGTALFTGKAKVKLIGDFESTISEAEFAKLLSFLVSRKYWEIPDDPINSGRITMVAGGGRFSVYGLSPWMMISVADEHGDKKTIARPSNAQVADAKKIPKALLEIEQAIFDTATRIKWKKI